MSRLNFVEVILKNFIWGKIQFSYVESIVSISCKMTVRICRAEPK